MKPFYSVFYLKSESISDEKIAVGMLLHAGEKPLFDYSEDKLKVAAKIIDGKAVDAIEKKLRNVKKRVIGVSENPKQAEAFDVKPFTSEYFDYLSRYSNNLLIYSKPSENWGDYRYEDFTSLFKLLVDKNYGLIESETDSFKKIVEVRLNGSKISDRLDIKYRIPKRRVKSILRSHKVDYIGANGKIFTGNVIDTSTDHYIIENKIYQIRALIEGLKDLSKSLDLEKNGRHVIYYNEPEGLKQKEVLHDLEHDDTRPFDLKPWGDFDEEEKYMEDHNVGKFSDLIASLS